MTHRPITPAATTLLPWAAKVFAPRPTISANVRTFVAIDTPIAALTHARVIDGTGAAPRDDQTLIIRDGRISQLGVAGSIAIPAGAQVIDLTGKSVIPGLVMVHERSEEHTSELQSRFDLVCRLLL